MEQNDLTRLQLIENLNLSSPPGGADAAMDAWERMARQLIPIVGEDGFNALRARSIFLSKVSFPWLPDSMEPGSDHWLGELKRSFDGQAPAQASEANIHLLVTFTGIVASLIGEELTTRILRLGWCPDTSASTAKEPRNG